MIYNGIQNTFLRLLQQGLWGKKPQETIPAPSNEEWAAIQRVARKQAVQGIVYDSICMLDNDRQPSMPTMIGWTVEIDSLERANKKQQQAIHRLHNLFIEENNLPFILLKGQAIARYYNNPLHRVCGDIDLYFYDKSQTAQRLIEQQGIKIEIDTERKGSNNAHYIFDGVEIDQRIRFMTLHNPFARKRLKKIQNSRLLTNKHPGMKIADITVPTLSPLADHVMQISHILKHLLTEGIGLRQCCDFARTLYATHDKIDRDELRKTLKTFGLYKFTLLMYAFIEQYLGFPKELLPMESDYDASPLLTEVWESGNFGFMDERNKKVDNVKRRKLNTFKRTLTKCLRFSRYAPGEAFWWPLELIYKNIR